MAVDWVSQGIVLFDFSYAGRASSLSGVDPTHVLSSLKMNIPTCEFQGDIIQIIAKVICMHFGTNSDIYFLWAWLGMFLLAQKNVLCEESDDYLLNI